MTPLHSAVHRNLLDLVELLLDRGANASAANELGYTPLHLVTGASVAEVLVDHGADIDARTRDGETPLHVIHDVEAARVLVNRDANLSATTDAGESVLHRAARQGSVERITLFTSKGVDVLLTSANGTTPLHLARGGKAVSCLLEAGSDINREDNAGYTPLHYAVLNSDEAAVEELLAVGADVNARNHRGASPLHLADELEIVHLLVDAGANVNAASCDGERPLHLLVHVEGCSDYLVQNGADINAVDKQRRTVLYKAVVVPEIEEIAPLLAAGADLNAPDANGDTPLHIMGEHFGQCGEVGLLELLDTYGADWERCNSLGRTPLHCAARKGNAEMVELLINRGVAIDCLDRNGKTPLDLAVKHPHYRRRHSSPFGEPGYESTVDLLIRAESRVGTRAER